MLMTVPWRACPCGCAHVVFVAAHPTERLDVNNGRPLRYYPHTPARHACLIMYPPSPAYVT
jgi:hypothetical protein